MEIAPAELEMKSLNGEEYKLRDWLTSYPFMLVALDPYKIESSWILDTAVRLFDHFSPADIRVGWICAADEAGCKEFLGPLSENYLTFSDPDRKIISSFEISQLPCLTHIRTDGYLQTAEGWNPKEWKQIVDWVAKVMAWTTTVVPAPDDPSQFSGTPT